MQFQKPNKNMTWIINTSVLQVLSNKLKTTYTKYIYIELYVAPTGFLSEIYLQEY